MPIIYTILLCFIGLFVLFIFYDNYLETTTEKEFLQKARENFSGEENLNIAEEEAKEDLEEQEVPNDNSDLIVLPGEKTDAEHDAEDKENILGASLSQEVEETFQNEQESEKAVGLFQSIVNFFTGKKTIEGFSWNAGHWGTHNTTHRFKGPDGKWHNVTVQKPNFPRVHVPAYPARPGGRRRWRRRHRHRRRRWRRWRRAWHHYHHHVRNYHHHLRHYNNWARHYHHAGMDYYRRNIAHAQQQREKQIRHEMEIARQKAVTNTLRKEWTKVGQDITNVKGKLNDYKGVKQSDENKNKVIKEAGTRMAASVGSRLVKQGNQNQAWESQLPSYWKTKVPSYFDQFNWSSNSSAANQYIATQKQYRLRENRIAENTNTRNAHWPTVNDEMMKFLKPYYSDGKIPANVVAQVEAAYGKSDDPYYWTLDKYKAAAMNKIVALKAGKDNEKTQELIKLKQQAEARQIAAISARDQAQIEMNAKKALAIEMNKARAAEAAEFAKQQAKRTEENNKLVKNMSGTMGNRLVNATTSKKLLDEYKNNKMIMDANDTTFDIRKSQNALNAELTKQRGTRQFLQDAKMENIREISLRARKNYDQKLNDKLKKAAAGIY